MSLLLEALKKAEKAKEEAQRAAKSADAGGGGLSLDESYGKHVRTRDELPDITRPVNIQTEDLGPDATTTRRGGESARQPAAAAAAQASVQPAPRSEAAPMPGDDPAAPERATARKVFEAKYKEPNPRLPFYITMGLLSVFAVGTVGYFWYQLRPPPALVNTNPPPAGQTQTADSGSPAVTPAAPSAPVATAPAPGAAALPGLPGSAPSGQAPSAAQPGSAAPGAAAPIASAPTSVQPPPAKPAAAAAEARAPSAPTASVEAPRKPAARRAPRSPAPATDAAAAPASANAALVNRGLAVDARIESGYADYQAGRFDSARTSYAQVLREDPAQRDALLGLAAIETRAQRLDLAESYYQRVLRLDPRDPYAHAALLALRSGQIDPVLAESRLKSLIATEPDASVLQASLGNQYAQQGRWAEAQQAYFKAHSADPENADYAYNLAVSLDHLRQTRLAAEYYRRALTLAEKREASFDRSMARSRAQALAR
jgi:tetratricopeptide (TPR) repeat protein